MYITVVAPTPRERKFKRGDVLGMERADEGTVMGYERGSVLKGRERKESRKCTQSAQWRREGLQY